MQAIGVVVNADKPEAIATGRTLMHELEQRGVVPLLDAAGAAALGRPDLAREPYPEAWQGAALVAVLGGDGTLLRAAKRLAPLGVPLLGINTGRLGFLTELEAGDIPAALDDLLAGRYLVEERMMLTARVLRDGQEIFAADGLNDAVIGRGPLARMVHFTAQVGGVPVADYAADGVIVATPTGSTAYSLSAGGPIVHPELAALLITPICPHTFNARSLVVPAGEAVTIRVHNPPEVLLSVDGQVSCRFAPGDTVEVRRAPAVARLVRRTPFRFYDVLRRKLAEPYRKIGTSFAQGEVERP